MIVKRNDKFIIESLVDICPPDLEGCGGCIRRKKCSIRNIMKCYPRAFTVKRIDSKLKD